MVGISICYEWYLGIMLRTTLSIEYSKQLTKTPILKNLPKFSFYLCYRTTHGHIHRSRNYSGGGKATDEIYE